MHVVSIKNQLQRYLGAHKTPQKSPTIREVERREVREVPNPRARLDVERVGVVARRECHPKIELVRLGVVARVGVARADAEVVRHIHAEDGHRLVHPENERVRL